MEGSEGGEGGKEGPSIKTLRADGAGRGAAAQVWTDPLRHMIRFLVRDCLPPQVWTDPFRFMEAGQLKCPPPPFPLPSYTRSGASAGAGMEAGPLKSGPPNHPQPPPPLPSPPRPPSLPSAVRL